MPVRTFLFAASALLCSAMHGQQLYFGAIGGTAITRDFPLFEDIYPGDTFGNPPSLFRHFSGPRSLILGGLVGVRLYGPLSLEANVLHRPWRDDLSRCRFRCSWRAGISPFPRVSIGHWPASMPQANPMREWHAHLEGLIQAAGPEWTFVRPGMFSANALRWWAPQIRTGDLVRWPYLEAPTAPVDERDIAAVAVRALRIEEMPAEEARREWSARMPPWVAEMLLNAWNATLGLPAFVTSNVEEISGRPPRTFREWAADHAAAFRS